MTFDDHGVDVDEKGDDVARNDGAGDATAAGNEPVLVRHGHGGEPGQGEEAFLPDEGVYDKVVVDEPVAEETRQWLVLPVEHGDEGDRVNGETEQDIENDQVGHENVATPAQCGIGGDGYETDHVGDDGKEEDEAGYRDVQEKFGVILAEE